ncbi:hypothetical protein OUZ56_029766 [Daphnia magna]|uniref:Uncharacterized protein n=1 Tax=Daphnia magna TaxID=35525 RepID=A0ABR0B7S0_9CRUS|nr:hypothetical protein OUZ56_029766 [Daphnia magna]
MSHLVGGASHAWLKTSYVQLARFGVCGVGRIPKKRTREKYFNRGKVKDQTVAESSESEDEVKKGRHDIVVRSDDKSPGAVQDFLKKLQFLHSIKPY